MKTGKQRKARRNGFQELRKNTDLISKLWESEIRQFALTKHLFAKYFIMRRSKHLKRRIARGYLKPRAEPRGSQDIVCTATEARIVKGMTRTG